MPFSFMYTLKPTEKTEVIAKDRKTHTYQLPMKPATLTWLLGMAAAAMAQEDSILKDAASDDSSQAPTDLNSLQYQGKATE
jgi:hypothetical protein